MRGLDDRNHEEQHEERQTGKKEEDDRGRLAPLSPAALRKNDSGRDSERNGESHSTYAPFSPKLRTLEMPTWRKEEAGETRPISPACVRKLATSFPDELAAQPPLLLRCRLPRPPPVVSRSRRRAPASGRSRSLPTAGDMNWS